MNYFRTFLSPFLYFLSFAFSLCISISLCRYIYLCLFHTYIYIFFFFLVSLFFKGVDFRQTDWLFFFNRCQTILVLTTDQTKRPSLLLPSPMFGTFTYIQSVHMDNSLLIPFSCQEIFR